MDTLLHPRANIRGNLLIRVQSLEKPKITSFFSSEKLSEAETTVRLDAYHCKYIKRHLLAPDSPRVDLKSYEAFCKNYESEHAALLLHNRPMVPFLLYLEKIVSQDKFIKFRADKLFEADIICHAKVLIKVMMLHGNFGESFGLLATKYKGNIYITRRTKSHEFRKETIKAVARHALFSDHPNSDKNTQEPYGAKFHCVFDWKLCDASVMLFSGVQGVNSDTEITMDTDPRNIQVARIKTKFKGSNERQHASYQSPYWWCQSYLLGNDDIHVVNIDEDDSVECINTIGLDTFLRDYEKHWKKSSDERISFLRLVMDLIKLRMTFVNCPLTVYEFYAIGENTIHYNVHSGRSKFTFLTDQYVNAIKEL
ncbi:hypothetical protein HA402_005486 [Bradysia odoriphaga]|nr:hypothetical protein HA402_005486 [Bradysia odoriphaga]